MAYGYVVYWSAVNNAKAENAALLHRKSVEVPLRSGWSDEVCSPVGYLATALPEAGAALAFGAT
jgi:hypothetical protein